VGAYRANCRENNNSKYSSREYIVPFVILHASLLLRPSHRKFKPTQVSRDVSANLLQFDSKEDHKFGLAPSLEVEKNRSLLPVPRFRISGYLAPQCPYNVFRYNDSSTV